MTDNLDAVLDAKSNRASLNEFLILSGENVFIQKYENTSVDLASYPENQNISEILQINKV